MRTIWARFLIWLGMRLPPGLALDIEWPTERTFGADDWARHRRSPRAWPRARIVRA